MATYPTKNKEWALVDFRQEPDHEWAAALYESYASDFEGNDDYSRSAMRLAEEIEADTAQCNRDFF